MNTSVDQKSAPAHVLTANTPREKLRKVVDGLATTGVTLGGLSVIGAILLIFFYLGSVVLPLLFPASVDAESSYSVSLGSAPKHVELEEKAELAVVFTEQGEAVFFQVEDGAERLRKPVSGGAKVAVAVPYQPSRGVVALGLDDGRVLPVRHMYLQTFSDDAKAKRTIKPRIQWPDGQEGYQIVDGPMQALAVRPEEESLTFAALQTGGKVTLVRYLKEESDFSDEPEIEEAVRVVLNHPKARFLEIAANGDFLYIAEGNGQLHFYQLHAEDEPTLLETIDAGQGSPITAMTLLTGQISVMVGTADGKVHQYFPVRNDGWRKSGKKPYELPLIRSFDEVTTGAVSILLPELRRKSLVAADGNGDISLLHSTSHRVVEQLNIGSAIDQLVMSPRSKKMVAMALTPEAAASYQVTPLAVENEHPEVSMSGLWSKVHYESYQEPQHVWQSSSSSNDFEPKFSLTPLSFGTLKAAFYAMLFAVPLAICGAIFTAQFMAPGMRKTVKPAIEIMEAMPTVILGFLAGLWLAPYVEMALPGIFMTLLFIPLSMVLFGVIWDHLPGGIKHKVPDGWQAALLIPVIVLAILAATSLSGPVETAFFGGNMPLWLRDELGIPFDQRNSLVVGLVMGFAVIPTIFSIAEDAVFSVPKHLSQGSLALGATPWQTLVRVVLLTASPGIFSAVMIGVGRAVGETMIVLMATGNTPVMDFSLFSGFRTLSANIAVEMPEAEVASTHYRLLFLSAFVLFMFTFAFNTVAEIVRQRLRTKYSNL